jgi:hypothetical protein
MNAVFIRVPMAGAGSILFGSSSTTSWTESAKAPRIMVSPASLVSTTIIQVLTVCPFQDHTPGASECIFRYLREITAKCLMGRIGEMGGYRGNRSGYG